ncbi:hypothetical protein OH76DRAFT_1051661 [Lentinus brumalis]|uniref:Uncharacterized protein n=1 Tax=Lentinus brumalis TaxID=2498619 RepID=A0A371CWK8_9APHY|nr:hypothetical protein OH76DRAFT_1051661 [Polyporus brumalis]
MHDASTRPQSDGETSVQPHRKHDAFFARSEDVSATSSSLSALHTARRLARIASIDVKSASNVAQWFSSSCPAGAVLCRTKCTRRASLETTQDEHSSRYQYHLHSTTPRAVCSQAYTTRNYDMTTHHASPARCKLRARCKAPNMQHTSFYTSLPLEGLGTTTPAPGGFIVHN